MWCGLENMFLKLPYTAPRVNVTMDPETQVIVPKLPMDSSNMMQQPSPNSIPIAFTLIGAQQLNGPVD